MQDLSGSRVALFLPCYIDQLAPRVGFATLAVLRSVGVAAEFPLDQTCCGQPLANAGCAAEARPLAERMLRIFGDFDYLVCPSGSCTAMVRHRFADLLGPAAAALAGRTFELCEFLIEVAGFDTFGGRFPHRVGLHHGCHGLRDLRLGTCSERVEPPANPVGQLLAGIDGLELVDLQRVDECCGFGGAFSVEERGVSATMGRDRLADHLAAGAEVIASIDMSCLLHLEGLARRQGDGVRLMHVAEILAAATVDAR